MSARQPTRLASPLHSANGGGQVDAATFFAHVLAQREAAVDAADAVVDDSDAGRHAGVPGASTEARQEATPPMTASLPAGGEPITEAQPDRSGPSYTIVHGRHTIQIALDRLVIPADQVDTFTTALECAQALEQLHAGAQVRIEQSLLQAKEQGFAQGRHEAHELSREEMTRTIERMARRFEAHEAATRQAIGTLALAVVGKLSASLGADKMVPALVEQAIQDLLPQQALRVRVPPELAQATRQRLDDAGLSAEVRPDETLSGFDCTIDCAHGQQLAGLDVQLAAVAHAIDAALPDDLPAMLGADAKA